MNRSFACRKVTKKTDLEKIGAIMGPKPDSNMSTLSVNTMWIPELLDMVDVSLMAPSLAMY